MYRIHTAIRAIAIALILLAPAGFAGDHSAAELPATNGAFYAISVQDIDTAIAWYTKHLGFTLESKAGNEARAGALLTRPDAVLELAEFATAAARDPALESHQLFGIFKLGFTTTELDQSFEILQRSGAEVFFPIVSTSDGKRTFGIKDMDGNIVQFYGQ